MQVPVSLIVASQTAKAVWGHVLAHESCVGIRLSEALLVVGTASRVPFTACDAEELPVAHGLPSATDGRRFTAQQGETRYAVAYLGEGTYEVAPRAIRHGTEVMTIELDGAVAAPPLLLLARCPSMGRTAALPSGTTCCLSCVMRTPSTQVARPSCARRKRAFFIAHQLDAMVCLIVQVSVAVRLEKSPVMMVDALRAPKASARPSQAMASAQRALLAHTLRLKVH